ncbi:MAG TPA: ribose-phosphate diphosphokinase [Anaerolineaceae bacterium]|nr:ribose-phosphate diphosphokinase [Anaerolineaceae bacterium]HOH19541.1 ribose-phosphate diphosphokinase [Anaerolineaceae bacterium]HOU43206.1 ribose-phosphate diphosphokinase [Anaerolineaceae bacterium]HPA32662.1 ribose-phosphate diphosphokinase [Anaerolineaceae bacterium]HQF44685.1 ribose-phosphate diphosphokinase [Anaerolineaceae bacterium]
MPEHPLRIFSGSAHPQLAQEIANLLGVLVGKNTTRQLPDSEIHVMIDEAVRDQDVFLVQPCPAPVNDHLMELLLYLDAFRRASAHQINVVIPYFPYARQDRMAKGREAVSARVVANLLENQGASRVMFVDIHNQAIQGFFNVPVDPVSAIPVLANYFTKPEFANAAIVSPDVGRANVAGKYAEMLNLPLVIMHKRRVNFQETKATHVVGDIKGRMPIIVDDMIASGSVLKQIDSLYAQGAEGKTWFAITHPVLLPSALEVLDRDDRIGKLVVTNTLPIPPEKLHPKIEVVSVAPLLADIIRRIHLGISISEKLILR